MPQIVDAGDYQGITSNDDSTNKEGTPVIIKFTETVDIPYVDSLEKQFSTLGLTGLAGIFDEFPNMIVERLVVCVSPDEVKKLEESARINRKNNSMQSHRDDYGSILSYFRLIVPLNLEVDKVIDRLRKDESIGNAYIESEITTPQHPSMGMDPMYSNQDYLKKGPLGIDAVAAWKLKGGDGDGVIFVDIEQGFKMDHEDLPTKRISTLPEVALKNLYAAFTDGTFRANLIRRRLRRAYTRDRAFENTVHGTGVLGIVVGVGYNNRGIIGIGHNTDSVIVCADLYFRSFADIVTLLQREFVYNKKRKGDILLLEAQGGMNLKGKERYVPIETDEQNYVAIRNAVDNGIIVIEAAGNGGPVDTTGNDLDDLPVIGRDKDTNTIQRQWIYKRGNPYRNSNAIMVGAASKDVPHKPLGFSNYGTRIDCYAWGEKVATTSMDRNNKDTYVKDDDRGFSGTSSASAIIAGVAICVQGMSKSLRNITLTPIQMRELLSSDKCGTRSNLPEFDKIGVMPDLQKIIDHMGFK